MVVPKPQKKTLQEKSQEKIIKHRAWLKSVAKRAVVRKKLPKIKRVTLSKIKKECIELAKKIVRLRDNHICQWCGKKVFGSNCHVSHVAPVSSGNVLCADPINMKVLCYRCHFHIWHKDPNKAWKWYVQKFPERVTYIESHRYAEVHWKYYDWIEIKNNLLIQLEHMLQ